MRWAAVKTQRWNAEGEDYKYIKPLMFEQDTREDYQNQTLRPLHLSQSSTFATLRRSRLLLEVPKAYQSEETHASSHPPPQDDRLSITKFVVSPIKPTWFLDATLYFVFSLQFLVFAEDCETQLESQGPFSSPMSFTTAWFYLAPMGSCSCLTKIVFDD